MPYEVKVHTESWSVPWTQRRDTLSTWTDPKEASNELDRLYALEKADHGCVVDRGRGQSFRTWCGCFQWFYIVNTSVVASLGLKPFEFYKD